jgi:hypothetical protein
MVMVSLRDFENPFQWIMSDRANGPKTQNNKGCIQRKGRQLFSSTAALSVPLSKLRFILRIIKPGQNSRCEITFVVWWRGQRAAKSSMLKWLSTWAMARLRDSWPLTLPASTRKGNPRCPSHLLGNRMTQLKVSWAVTIFWSLRLDSKCIFSFNYRSL